MGSPSDLTEYMRNALWYYDHYFIEKDRADQNEQLVTQARDVVASQNTELNDAYKVLGAWRTAAIVSGTVSVVLIALEIYTVYAQTHSAP